jgi:signal transduction histidine kinase
LQLSSGDWLRVHGSIPKEVFDLPLYLLPNLGLLLVAVLGLMLVAARSTVRPLIELAQAAHNLSNDLKSPPLAETGPSEVREAAQAFNTMQRRIRNGIEERERFLAAISHDLKTPVTRLRLRTEMLADADLRERFRSDVDDMQDLLDSALDFLRGQSVHEAVQPIDLVALLESLVDDYADHAAVTLQAPDALRFAGRPKALKRALVNLIENAVKYGGRADITVERTTDGIGISVQDNGPGLPEAELEKVFEPFYRLESSRNRDTGGSGLGMAIVRQIARSHGGEVCLSNRPEGGLRAELRLAEAAKSPAE